MDTVHLHLRGDAQPLDRFFQNCIGSCHAYLTLREDWREHARLIQREIGFRAVRSHGIFHDLVGIYQVPWGGERVFNFQNLDKIYDFWLSIGLKPFVELSFTPRALASGDRTVFHYAANVTPPKDRSEWELLIRTFATHLIERYGLEEVQTWYFEVWNEPDLQGIFWTGSMEEYFDLYALTARTLKSVHPSLKVGGPATSRNMWVKEMLDYCAAHNVPIDFLSTHHYCADAAFEMGEFSGVQWRGQKAMLHDVQRTVQTVRQSAFPNLPVLYTEWNVSPIHEDVYGKDSEFTAAFVLQTVKDLSGLLEAYSYWAISDVFEESGPGLTPFSGKYGLVNLHGIKKPVYHAFHFLSQLYDEELVSDAPSLRVTRSPEGNVRLLTWNFVEPVNPDFHSDYPLSGGEREEEIILDGLQGEYEITCYQVDREHGNAFRAWLAMGSPQYLTAAQVEQLKQTAQPSVCDHQRLILDGTLRIKHVLPPSGIRFYDIRRVG